MPLCFIEPNEAIRVVAETVGREARRQLLSEVVRAWVDDIPDDELAQHYAKAVEDLDDDDLSMLAAWHASLEAGISEEQALDTVLPWLSGERLMELAAEAVELYCWDRLGSDN